MTGWTLGAVKARHLALEAYCQSEGCGRFSVFDLDRLIASVGAGFAVSGIPPLSCTVCGGPMAIKLAAMPPEREDKSPPAD